MGSRKLFQQLSDIGAQKKRQEQGQASGDLSLFFFLLWLCGLHPPEVCAKDRAEHEVKGAHSVRLRRPHRQTGC